jgi:hypothetical protein
VKVNGLAAGAFSRRVGKASVRVNGLAAGVLSRKEGKASEKVNGFGCEANFTDALPLRCIFPHLGDQGDQCLGANVQNESQPQPDWDCL